MPSDRASDVQVQADSRGGVAAGGDNLRLAIVVILITNLALSLGDAAVKGISASFVLWQIFVLRAVIAIPVVLLISRLRAGSSSLAVRAPLWVAVRSLLLTFMWVSYYTALPHLALGIAAAAYYTLPIFIALFSAMFIGDRILPMGWVAIALGLAGVLLILKPDADGFNLYILLPIASAIFYASAMVLTRTKCRDENPLVLSLGLNMSFIVVGLAATAFTIGSEASFLSGPWSAMGLSEWGAMALLAGAVIVGSVGAAIAYQIGKPAVVAIFDFAYVGFAAVWGMLFFNERLDAITLVGMVMIVVAGILAMRRP